MNFPADPLVMWTVYDHPTDYPDHFAAVRWLVFSDGKLVKTKTFVRDTLDEVRAQMMAMHLTCLSRNETDDAKIVETWL